MSGRIKDLIEFLKSGFVKKETLNEMLEMMEEGSEMNKETMRRGLVIDRQEPIVRAYIMQAMETIRKTEKKEDEKFAII